MRKFLLAAVAVVAVSVSATAHSEPKRDILGFHTGMPYQEAMSAMAKICKGKIESGQSTINPIYSPSFFVECSLGERQVRESPDSPKLIMREEGLTLDIAVNIPEKPLSAVTYRFVTSAVASDLVQSTFEQYGFPCNKWRSGSETLCYPASLEGSFVAAQLPLDPPYQTSDVPPDNFGAVLKGRPGLWLELLKEPLSSGGVLTLLDSRIAKADVEAGKAAYQANNPPPKF